MYIKLEQRVKTFIVENQLIDNDDIVVVATSGGADSMAMLNTLYNIFKADGKEKTNLVAVTVNHGIRGYTADRDMKHVENFCSKLGIKCITFNAKVDGTAIPKDAQEEWARQLRYKYFSKIPSLLKVSPDKVKIATAHTKSDQAETVLFRISRNSSYKSLMGIPIKRDNYIRPFLCLTREDVEHICLELNIDYMTDETNLEDDYARNKIRHSVIPVLTQINSGALDHINDLAVFNTKLNDYFLHKAKEIESRTQVGKNKWDISGILDNHELEVDAFINYILDKSGVQLSKHNTELIKETMFKGGSIELNKKTTVRVENYTGKENKKILILVTRAPDVSTMTINRQLANYIDKHEAIHLNHRDRKYSIIILKVDLEYARLYVKNAGVIALGTLTTYEGLFGLGLKICPCNPNDEFRPACRTRRKIRKMYTEMNIIPENISSVPCIKTTNDKVVWLYNIGFTDGFSPLDKELNKTEMLLKSRRPNEVYIIKSI